MPERAAVLYLSEYFRFVFFTLEKSHQLGTYQCCNPAYKTADCCTEPYINSPFSSGVKSN